MTTKELTVLAADAGGEHNPLIPVLSELVVGLIAFLVLLFVLARYVFPQFERVYRERAEAIEGGMNRAATAEAEAEQLLVQYRAQLADARAEASRIRTDAQSERASIVEAARVEAREVAQAEAARGRQQLEAEIAMARAELSRDIGRISVELASQIVGENLADRDATRRTVDRFLTGMGEMVPSDAGGVR